MAIIDFPNSPIIGDLFTANGRTWEYTGVTWDTVETEIVVGPTGPANRLYIGTVTSTGPAFEPSVTITGTPPNQTLDFVLKQGEVGPTGPDALPTQTGNAGKYLKTDGTSATWEVADALPSQTGNSGKLLTTDGSITSWSNELRTIDPAKPALVAYGAASQTANIQEWYSNSGSALASISASGKLTAVTKSFEIDHPTKTDMRLRYGSLEGPENGVYARGKIQGSVIKLPDYWTGLVDEETITVNLTPIGKPQELFVDYIEDNKVFIGGSDINAFYTVFAERKDVDKLIVEF